MNATTEAAHAARERIHAYVQKYPGQLSEDIAHNNARINKPLVGRTLRWLVNNGRARREGNGMAARFFPS